MPWREVSVMDQRREFVRVAAQDGANRRELKRMQYLQLPAPAQTRLLQPSDELGETSEHRRAG